MKTEEKEELEQQEEVGTTEEEQAEETQEGSEEEIEDQEQKEESEEKSEESSEEEESEEESGEEVEKSEEEESDAESEEGLGESEEKSEESEEEVDLSTNALIERAKNINPDANDDNYLQTLVGHLDKLSDYRDKSQKANSKLIEVFETNPTVADILKDVIDGADLRVAIARHFSADDLVPEEDDPDFDAWKENAQKREENIKNSKEQTKELAKNTEKSKETIKSFAEKNKLSEKETTQFLETIDQSLDNLYKGVVSEDFLEKMLQAYNYKKDVKQAAELGEVKGKNKKIEAKKKEKAGDGVPKVQKGAVEEEGSESDDHLGNIIAREKARNVWNK